MGRVGAGMIVTLQEPATPSTINYPLSTINYQLHYAVGTPLPLCGALLQTPLPEGTSLSNALR